MGSNVEGNLHTFLGILTLTKLLQFIIIKLGSGNLIQKLITMTAEANGQQC